MSRPPYLAFTASWPGPQACGGAFAPRGHGDGTLSYMEQSWSYEAESGIHGLAFGPGERSLYAADTNRNQVWTHRLLEDGTAQLVAVLEASGEEAHPRHLAVHPRGNYMYVLMEAENTIVLYSLDQTTGAPTTEVAKYSLLADGTSRRPFSLKCIYR